MHFPSSTLLELQNKRQRGEFLVGAAIGSGAFAQAAKEGGADFLIALNAGRFRLMGAPSIASMLPIKRSNPMVNEFSRQELTNRLGIPVFFGASALDPQESLLDIVKLIESSGCEGVINFPTVAHFPLAIQHTLESYGCGFSRELALLSLAKQRGLETIAHVTDKQQARSAVEAGCDIVCFNFGWNAGGVKGLQPSASLVQNALVAKNILREVRRANEHCVLLVEGGGIQSADDLIKVMGQAAIDGYIGGSTIDRLPVEDSVANQTLLFKSALTALCKNREKNQTLKKQFIHTGLVGSSQALSTLFERVDRLSHSTSCVLASGEPGSGRQPLLRALARLRHGNKVVIQSVDLSEQPAPQALVGLFGRRDLAPQKAMLYHQQQLIILRGLDKMPLTMQLRLARYIDQGRYQAVGGRKQIDGGAYLMFASDIPLQLLIEQHRIQKELLPYLQANELMVPAVRDRLEDIEEIFSHAFAEIDTANAQSPLLSPAALRRLQAYTWPGNIPEVRSVAEAMMQRHGGQRISEDALIALLAGGAEDLTAKPQSEREVILDALWRHGFHRGKTARFLGITRKTLYNKIQRYGLVDG